MAAVLNAETNLGTVEASKVLADFPQLSMVEPVIRRRKAIANGIATGQPTLARKSCNWLAMCLRARIWMMAITKPRRESRVEAFASGSPDARPSATLRVPKGAVLDDAAARLDGSVRSATGAVSKLVKIMLLGAMMR